ncbi:hypothetical protein AM1_0226 [Acaryochloris marina MBIC11017]|uniref:Uncharacterized protein n=1 Tax=Acaryochloris marina (strain MBIC 11017) TaxID=329726 RepID=B0C7Q2_ACAM1|nr:hypothetical protein AM1_0226 [Acaryochloris marina MBIC11017]
MTTCYYLRKLLAQSANQLQSFIVEGAGIVADEKSDINHVLESLYLEELDISLMARDLEVIVQLQTILSRSTSTSSQPLGQLAKVERRIFWILGLKKTMR